MCGDNAVQPVDSLLFEVTYDLISLRRFTAVDQHILAVSGYVDAVPLPHVNKMNRYTVLYGSCRRLGEATIQKRRYDKNDDNADDYARLPFRFFVLLFELFFELFEELFLP